MAVDVDCCKSTIQAVSPAVLVPIVSSRPSDSRWADVRSRILDTARVACFQISGETRVGGSGDDTCGINDDRLSRWEFYQRCVGRTHEQETFGVEWSCRYRREQSPIRWRRQ